jgi:hypothetical protein
MIASLRSHREIEYLSQCQTAFYHILSFSSI